MKSNFLVTNPDPERWHYRFSLEEHGPSRVFKTDNIACKQSPLFVYIAFAPIQGNQTRGGRWLEEKTNVWSSELLLRNQAAGKCHATCATSINIFSGVKVRFAFEWAAAFFRLHVTSFTVYPISCNHPFWRKRVSFCLSGFHFSITSSSSQTNVETRPLEKKWKKIKDNGGSPELLETKEIIDFVERSLLRSNGNTEASPRRKRFLKSEALWYLYWNSSRTMLSTILRHFCGDDSFEKGIPHEICEMLDADDICY